MFLFIFSVLGFTLYRNKNFGKYQPYCQATYGHIPQKKGFKLLKLIVIHRHGDRTPMKTLGSFTDECVGCDLYKESKTEDKFTISKCFKEKCTDGALTKKGYKQMLKLGRFIKTNYETLVEGLKIEDILLRATSVKRTNVSLNGVITGLFTEESIPDIVSDGETEKREKKEKIFGEKISFQIPKNETLVGYKTCPRLTHIMGLPSKKGFAGINKKNNLQIITDNYLYSICRNMEIDCNFAPCDENETVNLVDGSFKTWTYQSLLLKSHKNVRQFIFGKFAKDLHEVLRDNKKVSVMSAHDNSLSYVLAGLGTQVIERPPLASAIFLEIWAYNGVKYIRILFNNFICATKIHKSTNIPYEKFIKHLEDVQITDSELKEECDKL